MKLYLHYQDVASPVTLAVNVTNRWTTLRQLKQTFIDAFNKNHLHQSLDVATCDVVKHSGSQALPDNAVVVEFFNEKQDLFLVRRSDMAAVKEKISVKQAHLEQDPVFTEQAPCADLRPGTVTSECKGSYETGVQSKRALMYQCLKTLGAEPQNVDTLKTLVEIYFAVGHWRKTLKYAESGRKHYPNDPLFRLRVAQCHMMSGDPDTAVQQLELFIAQEEINRTETSGTFVQEARVALSRAYVLLGQKAKAFLVIQAALKNDRQYLPALEQYAKLTHDLGTDQALEAVTIILTAMVNDRGSKKFERTLANICREQSTNELLERALGSAWASVPALMLLATTFRDNGAIEKAESILDRALVVAPGHYAAMLMYVHVLEVLDRHEEAFDKTLSFLHRNSCQSVAGLLSHLDRARGHLHLYDGCHGSWESKDISLLLEAPPGESDSVLQAVALWFTLVKIIYVKGALCLLGPLLKLLDPFYNGENLHKTFIRNEAAYYGCICRLMCSGESPRMPLKQDNFLYFASDSHCLTPAWGRLIVATIPYTIHPILSTGTKLWHLRRDGIFYPKVNFYNALRCIPDGAIVVFNFGEIDCRESLQKCVDDCKYESLEEAVVTLIDIYIDVLLDLVTRHHWLIYVHPVPPVLTRLVVMEFNKHLGKRLSTTPQLRWLDFVHDLFTSDGSCLQKIYDFDGVHLHPGYVHLLEKTMNKA
ncbi:hypothetical protein LSAT2_010398 [Lamellibrachia satsuma]|nr:hypothetical protein LSAT2_010398 [Lamellibrachia satsuma]